VLAGLTVLCLLLAVFPAQILQSRTQPPLDWRSNWKKSTPGGVYAYRQGEYIHVGNEHLERVFRISDDVVRTVQFVNKASGKKPQSQDELEFGLEVKGAVTGELGGPDFKLVNIEVSGISDGGMRVAFSLELRRDTALKLTEIEEAYAHRRYQRKWLEVNWQGEGDVTVERIDVEEILFGWWYIANPSHYGYGQPVFAGDLYMGLEYPGAETGIDGYTYLRQYPGLSAKGGLKSKTAIWGVAKDPAHVEQAFFDDYLRSLHPVSPRPFVLYNLLGASAPTASKIAHWIDVIDPQAKKAGLPIDSYVVDDGWQDETSVWQPEGILFPDGFSPLVRILRHYQSHLGLWLTPDGATLDTRWGSLKGLEVSRIGERGNGGRYCIAGRRYNERLRQVLRKYVVNDGVNYFKFDYNVFGCNVPTHGHPIDRASKDAQVDAYIGVLKYLKSLSPNVHVAITTGMWLSPWWTLYADWVWLGGSDMGSKVPSLTPHDSEMTYRDSVMYHDFFVEKYVFPISSLMTHGFWVQKGTAFPQFMDNCMLTIGRGITDWEILTSPELMNTKRYEFLSKAVRWGKVNWDILSHSKMILGDPGKGEIYGYAHVGKGAALVVLRNPSLEGRVINLSFATIGIAPGLTKNASLTAFEVYPRAMPMEIEPADGGAVSVQVLGAQTKIIAVVWDRSLIDQIKF
jgi:hypothetical protein